MMTILALLGGTAILLALAASGWLVVQMRAQQERLAARLDALARQVTAPGGAPNARAVAAAPIPSPPPMIGERAPAFALETLDGGCASLASLLAPGKPLLLVFTHPRCGPCYELLPDIAGWQRVYGDRLTIALVSGGARETNLAMTAEYGISLVLLQQEQEVADALGISQLSAALLITPDGRIATEPRYGANALRQLVAETLGLALPQRQAVEARPVQKGERAPALRRPDLAGNVVDLAASRREPTLVLFWSPGCTHCQDLLPTIRAFEQAVGPERLVIVSRGPIGLNQDVGFRATVLLDDDSSISRTFGVSGTPAAVLLDPRGVVATPVARGVVAVRSALGAVEALFSQSLAGAAD
jgi:thiol-disulfide isomerase/thioredoxin